MPIANDPVQSIVNRVDYSLPALLTEALSQGGLPITSCNIVYDQNPGPGGLREISSLAEASKYLKALADYWNELPIQQQQSLAESFQIEARPFNFVPTYLRNTAAYLDAYDKRDTFLIDTLQNAMNVSK